MKALITFLRRGNRNQSIGLITIGLAMLAGSNFAEQSIKDWGARELVQLIVILAGTTATAFLFRRTGTDTHRE
jgi:hypothetical protein